MNLARRTVASISWNMASNTISVVVLFGRSVLLARWLPVEVFGVYAYATAIVRLSIIATGFGMESAFLHRAPETENEGQAAAVHFTLKLIFTLTWAAFLIIGAFTLTSGPTRLALLALTLAVGGIHLAQTPRLILTRRVQHRRLAVLDLVNTLLTTAAALWLAWQGAALWALLVTDLVTLLLTLIFFYGWRPVWRPRLAWSPAVVRYYLRFGSHSFLASVLLRVLDRVDDLWTGFYLGQEALGFYSRAYAFATYPHQVLAAPVDLVAGGTYAELKADRLRLSKAFFRVNAFLVRTGFFLAGALTLAAPEFIRLVLGEKWLPMLNTFRLMLIFTLLDPIKVTTGYLFFAVGKPQHLSRVQLGQLLVILVGLYGLGPRLGITGVALAVDAMMVTGIALLLWQARAHVSFSPGRLFGVPSLALILGILLTAGVLALPGAAGTDWQTGLVKVVAFSLTYGVVLFIFERKLLYEAIALQVWRRGKLPNPPNSHPRQNFQPDDR